MRDQIIIHIAIVAIAASLAFAAATPAPPGCSIKFVYPSSPSTSDSQNSPVLFVKPTHNDSVHFVVKYSGLIPESAASRSAFAIFEIFSGGAVRTLLWQAKTSLALNSAAATVLDHVTYVSVPTAVLRSDTYSTAAAAVFVSESSNLSAQDAELCQRQVNLFFEEGNARSSVSDNGAYPMFCDDAANDEEVFAHFKIHPAYSQIVTSLDRRQALALIPRMRKHASKDDIQHVIELSDSIGGALQLDLDGIVANPSTLRYITVALLLSARFGPTSNMRIVELGGGFGGHAIALAALPTGGFRSYVDIDLVESCLLATKHVQLSAALPSASDYEREVLGQFSCIPSQLWNHQTACDLFISNYALSELSAAEQTLIIRDVVASCQRGHIEANDISRHHGLAGSSTADLVQALHGVGLQVVQRALFMEGVSLQVTVIEWGCGTPGCDDNF